MSDVCTDDALVTRGTLISSAEQTMSVVLLSVFLSFWEPDGHFGVTLGKPRGDNMTAEEEITYFTEELFMASRILTGVGWVHQVKKALNKIH